MVIEASYTKVEITPPLGLRLGGYAHRLGKPAREVHDDLYARLLMLTTADAEVVIVQLDLLGLYRQDALVIKEAVSKATGVERGNVIVASTHTHSAPETIIPMWPNTLPYSEGERKLYNEWFSGIVGKVGEAARELNGTEKAEVAVGIGEAGGLCFNRSFKGGLVDEELPILAVKIGNSRIALLNYACHPVCNTDLGFSADYPGVLYDSLLRRGVESIFITGATGDIDPVRKGRGYMGYMGEYLASTVVNALASLKPTGYTMDMVNIGLRLPARVVNEELARVRYEEALRKVKDKGGLPNEPTESIWADEDYLRLMYSDEEYAVSKVSEANIDTEVTLLRLGDLLLVAIPGEPFVETGLAIKSKAVELGFRVTMVAGYVNDYVGYIPTKASFIMNTYEARLARWSRVTEEAEGLVRSRVFNAIKDIR
ncbi:MAG: hypothetical protein RXO25_04920 [Caldivirga sp.]